MRTRGIAIIIGLVAIAGASHECAAQQPDAEKLRLARAAAVRMVQPSGPLHMASADVRTPPSWRTRARVAGNYSGYSDRYTFVLPSGTFYPCGYGYGGYFGYPGYVSGYGSRWGLVYGYSTW